MQIDNKVDKADKATTAEALAGSDDTKWMTPAKTREAIERNSGYIENGTMRLYKNPIELDYISTADITTHPGGEVIVINKNTKSGSPQIIKLDTITIWIGSAGHYLCSVGNDYQFTSTSITNLYSIVKDNSNDDSYFLIIRDRTTSSETFTVYNYTPVENDPCAYLNYTISIPPVSSVSGTECALLQDYDKTNPYIVFAITDNSKVHSVYVDVYRKDTKTRVRYSNTVLSTMLSDVGYRAANGYLDSTYAYIYGVKGIDGRGNHTIVRVKVSLLNGDISDAYTVHTTQYVNGNAGNGELYIYHNNSSWYMLDNYSGSSSSTSSGSFSKIVLYSIQDTDITQLSSYSATTGSQIKSNFIAYPLENKDMAIPWVNSLYIIIKNNTIVVGKLDIPPRDGSCVGTYKNYVLYSLTVPFTTYPYQVGVLGINIDSGAKIAIPLRGILTSDTLTPHIVGAGRAVCLTVDQCFVRVYGPNRRAYKEVT